MRGKVDGMAMLMVFGLQGNEYIWLPVNDHCSEWLMKHEEETNRGDRDGQTVAERERERPTNRQFGCRVGNAVFLFLFFPGFNFDNGDGWLEVNSPGWELGCFLTQSLPPPPTTTMATIFYITSAALSVVLPCMGLYWR